MWLWWLLLHSAPYLLALGYGAAVWAMLRYEAPTTLLALGTLTALAVVLRTIYLHQYPTAYFEDELKIFSSVTKGCGGNWLLEATSIGFPCFIPMMGTGIPYLDWHVSQFWAIRGYSMVASSLCVLYGFAVARAFGCRVPAALVGALLFACLPWAIFYGRISEGGEYVVPELFTLWAIGSLLNGQEWIAACCVGAFGLITLLPSYPPIRIYWHLTALVAVLSLRDLRARLALAGIAVLAFLTYIPALLRPGALTWAGFWPGLWMRGAHEPWASALQRKVPEVFRVFWQPIAEYTGTGCAPAAAVHPVWLLPFAVLGACVHPIVALMAVVTALPAVLSMHGDMSSHQLLPVYPVVALAIACGLDSLTGRGHAVFLAALAGLVLWWSVTFFFSDAFWASAHGAFEWCHGPHTGTSAEGCF